MDNNTLVEQHFDEHRAVMEAVKSDMSAQIVDLSKMMAKALGEDKTIMWCGNGGSASDSQHLAAELVGRYKKNREPLRSVALTTDTSVLTCIANDYGYDDVFIRQVKAVGRKGDILIAISTSGNSENVLRAVKAANEMGIISVALLGKGGGPIKELATHSLVIPSQTTARIQEAHIFIGHMFCELIEKELGFA
ncbi:D-sedoheptulose 7-phosphate isomerase [Terasakiella sp. A23]|uniref:D-sedoheptulose-7-phosphate isomerase n=1 Tax=Terasakiella sp. FCG-A23 TaxID=3080561 RepID=UPI0029559154|nr:D-sedoheptulose 7-phosphate isomerase [Terasakiella sp. A23]MDV7340800.1 D-sedoheptulose 7-phosphate isomerase [Terasakiella sp. A23]